MPTRLKADAYLISASLMLRGALVVDFDAILISATICAMRSPHYYYFLFARRITAVFDDS